MHLLMILTVLAVSWILRSSWTNSQDNWDARWQKSLFFFLFPPLLIFMTAIALLSMGPQGKMGGLYTGWLSYALALFFWELSLFCASSWLLVVGDCYNLPATAL